MPSRTSLRQVAVWCVVTIGVSVLLIGALVSGVGTGTADDPLEATETLDFDDAHYYPANESVRIVVTRGGTGPRYKTISFEQFAQYRCDQIAINRVQRVLDERYTDAEGYTSSGLGNDGVHVSALIDPRTHPDYFHLLHAFPESVKVTLQYDGGTENCTVPIHIDWALGTPKTVSV